MKYIQASIQGVVERKAFKLLDTFKYLLQIYDET